MMKQGAGLRGGKRWFGIVAGVMALVTGGCAGAGATLGSGVGDAFLSHPPYYAGKGTPGGEAGSGRAGHLPVAYQRGASQASIFDPSLDGAVSGLLAEMTAFLDSLGMSEPLVEGGRVSAVTHADTRFPPDVRFGCVTESGLPDDECAISGDTALGRGGMRMQLSVGRPAPEWTAWMGRVMAETDTEGVLVVTLEVGQYLVRQRGLRGRKEVELGTDHVIGLPWLTSLETPVTVLQLTGALVGPDGKALRVGAEGLVPRRTRMALSAIGAQELITQEDVAALASARREDLPGKPLVWQVALRTLVARLLDPVGGA